MKSPNLITATLLLVLSFVTGVHAEVTLPSILGSHMVLQRETPITLWGWDDGGQKVTVQLGSDSASSVADDSGLWMVELKPLKAGGPHKISISGTVSCLMQMVQMNM